MKDLLKKPHQPSLQKLLEDMSHWKRERPRKRNTRNRKQDKNRIPKIELSEKTITRKMKRYSSILSVQQLWRARRCVESSGSVATTRSSLLNLRTECLVGLTRIPVPGFLWPRPYEMYALSSLFALCPYLWTLTSLHKLCFELLIRDCFWWA